MTFGSSSRLTIPAGVDADLLIFAVGSCRSWIFAAPAGMYGSGTVNVAPEAGVEPLREVAGELEVLALVLADRHAVGLVEQDVGGLQDRVGEQADAWPGRVPCLAVLSLNCVIRLASPNPVMQPSTHSSCACSGTCDWTNTVHRAGSSPSARSWAAALRVRAASVFGSCSTVIACRSGTK